MGSSSVCSIVIEREDISIEEMSFFIGKVLEENRVANVIEGLRIPEISYPYRLLFSLEFYILDNGLEKHMYYSKSNAVITLKRIS